MDPDDGAVPVGDGGPAVIDPQEPVTYDCAGLRVRSSVPLAARPVAGGRPPDVVVTVGAETEQPYERPSADLVAELVVDGAPWYTFCRVGDLYVGRFFGVADFEISADLRQVVCRVARSGNPLVVPAVLAGTIVAFLLMAAGQCVLHASAVEVAGGVVAFVGPSGRGKTTMAALMCAAGAPLVADDLLPLEMGPDAERSPVLARRSSFELRIRPKGNSLLERFPAGTPCRPTTDDRVAVSPPPSASDRLPLRAVIAPQPDRVGRTAVATRLSTGESTLRLAQSLRIEGWRDRLRLRQQFADVGRVAADVPVYDVSVPWGPPFAADLTEQVLASCGLNAPLSEQRPGGRANPPRRSSAHPRRT